MQNSQILWETFYYGIVFIYITNLNHAQTSVYDIAIINMCFAHNQNIQDQLMLSTYKFILVFSIFQ